MRFSITFKITLENKGDGANSCFRDLFLDVMLLADGSCYLLDQDELDLALEEGVITEADHQLVCRQAQLLMQEVPGKKQELAGFVRRYMRKILNDIPNATPAPFCV